MDLVPPVHLGSVLLASYLDVIASERGLREDVRKTARVAADTLAASLHHDDGLQLCLDNHPPLPLAGKALTRSSIYALHYLWNLDRVVRQEPLGSISTYLKKNRKHWNKKAAAYDLEEMYDNTDAMMLNWNELSETVHIIPKVELEEPGNYVSFSVPEDLGEASHHAGIVIAEFPEFITTAAHSTRIWRTQLAYIMLLRFRNRNKKLFLGFDKDVKSHLNGLVLPSARKMLEEKERDAVSRLEEEIYREIKEGLFLDVV